MEQNFKNACAHLNIPGVVLQASDSQRKLHYGILIVLCSESTKHLLGSFKYAASFGVRSLSDSQPAEPLREDAVLRIASCTKLITAVAVMQCVENGKLNLDEDVSKMLHELKDIDILTGFSQEGAPQFKKANQKITLRHALQS